MTGGGGRGRAISTAVYVGLTAVLVWTEPASAHAPPQATGIFSSESSGSGSPEWVRTNRGVIVRGVPDAAPRLLCNDAYSASLSELVPMIAAPDALVVATYDAGILRIESDGCQVQRVEAPLADRHVLDLAGSADGARYVALLSPKGTLRGGVLVSTDAGRTWEERGEIPAFGSALRVAPSDSDRVYVTAQVESESGEAIHRLFVSSDAGATFAPHPVTLLDSEVRAYVLATDPLAADRVLLRTLPGNPEEPERLLLSEDGGENLSEVFSTVGPLVVAFGDDVVWLGGQAGLFRSDDRAKTFQQLPSTLSHISCLSPAGSSLTACGYQDLAFGVFTAGMDTGAFLPELRFPDVSAQVACGDDSDVVASCQANFQDWLAENAPTTSGGTAGASTTAPVRAPGGGGKASCTLSAPTTTTSASLALLFGISCWSRRWHRKSSRRHARSA